jgi:hypothetical protein
VAQKVAAEYLIRGYWKMGTRTGCPRGRPKGAKNKRTAEREAAMREKAAQIESALGGAFEGDALAYLMSVYKDPLKPENVRIDAAKAAIRYERPALSPIERRAESDTVPLAERIKSYLRTDTLAADKSKLVEFKKQGQRE